MCARCGQGTSFWDPPRLLFDDPPAAAAATAGSSEPGPPPSLHAHSDRTVYGALGYSPRHPPLPAEHGSAKAAATDAGIDADEDEAELQPAEGGGRLLAAEPAGAEAFSAFSASYRLEADTGRRHVDSRPATATDSAPRRRLGESRRLGRTRHPHRPFGAAPHQGMWQGKATAACSPAAAAAAAAAAGPGWAGLRDRSCRQLFAYRRLTSAGGVGGASAVEIVLEDAEGWRNSAGCIPPRPFRTCYELWGAARAKAEAKASAAAASARAGSRGSGSRRRDCHFADTPSPSLLNRLLKGETGAANGALADG